MMIYYKDKKTGSIYTINFTIYTLKRGTTYVLKKIHNNNNLAPDTIELSAEDFSTNFTRSIDRYS